MRAFNSFTLIFITSFILTMLGVFLFFKPIALEDTVRLSLPSYLGTLYILMCALIYQWAYGQLSSSFKAAWVVTLPQVALIIDLVIRGERGPVTAAAGIALLIAVWFSVAFIHQMTRRYTKPSTRN